MHTKLLTLFFLLVSFIAQSQSKEYFVKAEGGYFVPLATLADRFTSVPGFVVTFGKTSEKSLNWAGKFEFFRFGESDNTDLSIRRIVVVNNKEVEFVVPLKPLSMRLEVASLSAEAHYDILKETTYNCKFIGSFGIHRWTFWREQAKDSLFSVLKNGTVSGTSDTTIFVEYLNVPSNTQQDWSGGFTAGLSGNVKITDPLWFSVSASYKAIIGELWSALSLDMENVSAMQFYEIRAGFFAEF